MARSRNSDPVAIARARRFRRESTESERRLWQLLRGKKLGYRVRRQHPLGPYILDFFIFEARLCIEVDGEFHALRVVSDATRDDYLLKQGIESVRIPSLSLWGEHEWLEYILQKCEQRTKETL